MTKVNPKISELFLEEIKNLSSKIIEIDGVQIMTCKNVFPPRSQFSQSSEKLHTIFGDLNGKKVLDVGTGTGFHAIQAVNSGAMEVVAIDINPEAIRCAKDNVNLNNVAEKVTVIESDLFDQLPTTQKFDIVIANLPIVDFPLEGMAEIALYDPEYRIRKRFLEQVGNYLNNGGIIIMTHINFKSDGDFEAFEQMLASYGYKPEKYIAIENKGYIWRLYRIINK